jgi:hypothetical protein
MDSLLFGSFICPAGLNLAIPDKIVAPDSGRDDVEKTLTFLGHPKSFSVIGMSPDDIQIGKELAPGLPRRAPLYVLFLVAALVMVAVKMPAMSMQATTGSYPTNKLFFQLMLCSLVLNVYAFLNSFFIAQAKNPFLKGFISMAHAPDWITTWIFCLAKVLLFFRSAFTTLAIVNDG